ncbi:unnamed protein product [Didymodactylos carnosus]|uniref:MACPF domain-containing protein n=1 Tax=Didymodactylos carnosus TaxID=1234261 RepID=A0A813ZZM2_9BILA|nr:unnamed protein product [Didymodactylos carnosus]CAF0905489.1 unnamed protein product [Didymodactylos carnosus]CAF3589993.1 unnamed protein product [Didymodactylos carnosus]CAF3687306.1 unnamed protein product [Didymodactylos carnosus]
MFRTLLWLNFLSLSSFSNGEQDQFDLKNARQALCPIVGFHGMFCPGDETTTIPASKRLKLATSEPVELPNSVGMGIDISTGDVLLPVLELSKGSEIWTDKESGGRFLVPLGLTLTEKHKTEDSVKVRLFSTETDLVNVWLKNAEEGGWTGGQLAGVENIADVYQKYFKDDQSMAITQDFQVLYAINVTNESNLKLNKYAQRAVSVLTNDYDQTLYESFLDAWGTHVILSTRVGGMKEQQIQLKNCILHTTDISDGLSREVLEDNLKQELLEQQPCIDRYYYSRRKRLLDHRIGGNILLINNNTDDTDDNLWKTTIVQDPALLSVQKYIPWYDLIENVKVKDNLKKAVNLRINRQSLIRTQQVQQIRDERRQMVLRAKVIRQSNGYEWTVGNDIDLQNVVQCTTKLDTSQLIAQCNTATMMSACALGLRDSITQTIYIETKQVPVCYERNNMTGTFRAVARRQYGERNDTVRTGFINRDVTGEWSESGGCSTIVDKCDLYSGSDTVYLCSGCNVECQTNQNTQRPINCKCSCPTYPIDYDAKPYLPYC